MRVKDQGTGWERDVEGMCKDAGLKVWRLAEHGSNDQGDLMVESRWGRIVIECKCRGNLPVHAAVGKANSKARHPSTFPARMAVVAWKRLVDTGGVRRRQAGRPVAVMDLEDLLCLLGGDDG